MQLATSWMTVKSTAWILTLNRRSKPLPLRPAAKSGLACWRWLHGPEQFFRKLRAAFLVGVGEAVLGWRRDTVARQDSGFESVPVTDIVESHGVGELGKEHRRKMAHYAEAAGFGFHAGLQSVTVDHSASNEVEHLLEGDHIGAVWCSFVHTPYRAAGISTQHQPAFSLPVKPFCGTTV